MYRVSKEYRFEAAHRLEPESVYGSCSALHGHSYRVRITVGAKHLQDGMVLNFNELDSLVEPIIGRLDHSYLNDQIEIPTAERIAHYIWEWLEERFETLGNRVVLEKIEVWETEKCMGSLSRR